MTDEPTGRPCPVELKADLIKLEERPGVTLQLGRRGMIYNNTGSVLIGRLVPGPSFSKP